MAITAVSGVKETDRYNSFTSTKHKDIEKHNQPSRSGGNSLKRIPVVVWLAVTPAMLNSSAVEPYMQMSAEQLTEIVEGMPKNDVKTADLRKFQSPQSEYPLGVAFFSRRKVQEIKPAIGNGVKANIVLTKYNNGGDPNDVNEVYYVRNSWKDDNLWHEPPEVVELIYHDTGDGKEYVGILVRNEIYKPEAQTPDKITLQEVKLDDESAQLIVDLMTGDTKWNNKARIAYSETKKPNVRPPEIVLDKNK